MERQILDDGGWFDPSASEKWDEKTRWDGRNRISLATGSQWNHEILYRTRSGTWIVNWWSQYQGRTETYRQVDVTEAVAWLIRNKHEIPEGVEAVGEV